MIRTASFARRLRQRRGRGRGSFVKGMEEAVRAASSKEERKRSGRGIRAPSKGAEEEVAAPHKELWKGFAEGQKEAPPRRD